MPHKQEEVERPSEFTPDSYPPFPADLPTVHLDTISLTKLLAQDPTEQDRTFEACRGRGFFYLDLRGGSDAGTTLLQGAEAIARVGEQSLRLPLAEKQRSSQGPRGAGHLVGYKMAGATVTDKAGTPDTAEFLNVAKDDMLLADGRPMTRHWPAPVMASRPLFRDYIRAAHGVGMLVLGVLARRLGIDEAEIEGRHRLSEPSGDHVRITRGPPREKEEMPEIQTPSHTDFGTITILMNWLGGLQMWSSSVRQAQLGHGQPREAGEWLWVKPRAGCAIVNLGDAAVKFTNGVLCSGRHRVVPAPGPQGRYPRYSIVYFVRPEDGVVLRRLKGEGVPAGAGGEEEECIKAKDWIYQKALGLRIKFQN